MTTYQEYLLKNQADSYQDRYKNLIAKREQAANNVVVPAPLLLREAKQEK